MSIQDCTATTDKQAHAFARFENLINANRQFLESCTFPNAAAAISCRSELAPAVVRNQESYSDIYRPGSASKTYVHSHSSLITYRAPGGVTKVHSSYE